MTADPLLQIENLTVRHGGITAVDGLCLDVFAGEVLGLLGPNGSGKSSTLGAVAGTLPFLEGRVAIAGVSLRERPDDYRRRVGLVPQELAVYEELTPLDNLTLFGSLYGLHGRTLRTRADEVLDVVGLSSRSRDPVRSLSGGMQRRLNLACALLHDPPVLLLDEPTVGLDVQSRDVVLAALRRLRQRGCALVFTTHHLPEAEELCDRVAVLERGRLLAVGSLTALCQSMSRGHAIEALLREPPVEAELLDLLTPGSSVRVEGRTVTIHAADERGMRQALGVLAELPSGLEAVATRRPALESVFVGLTGRRPGE